LILQRVTNGQVVYEHIFYNERVLASYIALFAGKNSFGGTSLHHIGDTPNPYEQAISIIGRTLSAFDEDNLIPCYGFGDGNMLTTFLTVPRIFKHLKLMFSTMQHLHMTKMYLHSILTKNHAMGSRRL
jgi:hypothetical protein